MMLSSPGKRFGFSIVEVLIASAILLLLMGLAISAMSAARRHSARVDAQLALDAEATSALSHVFNDVAESNANVVYAPSDQLLVFPLPRDISGAFTVEPSGLLRWGTLVSYRPRIVDGNTHLVRQTEDIADSVGPPQEPIAMLPLPDALWWDSATGPSREICEGFVSLTVTKPAPRTVNFVLHLRQSVSDRSYGIKIQTQVAPRN